MESLEGQTVNICGAVGKVCAKQTIHRRNGEEVTRVNVKLFDRTGELTVAL